MAHVWAGLEECDDGNDLDDDNCPTSCTIKYLWRCSSCSNGAEEPRRRQQRRRRRLCQRLHRQQLACSTGWRASSMCNPLYGPVRGRRDRLSLEGPVHEQRHAVRVLVAHQEPGAGTPRPDTNFYALAQHLLLPTNVGGSKWCYPFAGDPCQVGACIKGLIPPATSSRPTSARGAGVAATRCRAADGSASPRPKVWPCN